MFEKCLLPVYIHFLTNRSNKLITIEGRAESESAGPRCFRHLPVEQRQQSQAVKVQPHPKVRHEPQAVVLLCFAGGSGRRRRVVGSQWHSMEVRAKVGVLLLQQLRVHGEQAVQADLREGELPRRQSTLAP